MRVGAEAFVKGTLQIVGDQVLDERKRAGSFQEDLAHM